ncbi:MAG: aminodeoxychorismate/anthranilate synthase component II [Ruminococcus sp.]|nr:aminodeoxychorismate/anthranilate synthase component II [Ruminococcus sp.]
MILLIDNYDSRVNALYKQIQALGADVRIVRNDDTAPEEIAQMQPEGLIFSSGTGMPKDTGWCMELIRYFAGKIPVLGIGLGGLAAAECFGAALQKAAAGRSGRAFNVGLDVRSEIFRGLPGVIGCKEPYMHTVADVLPESLKIIARDQYGQTAAAEHTEYPVFAVMFRPEAFADENGKTMLENFIQLALNKE